MVVLNLFCYSLYVTGCHQQQCPLDCPASLPCICTLGEDKGANVANVSCDISKIASISFSHTDIKSLGSIRQKIAY